jgi:sec-independent protein translocase protein TatA
MIDYSLNIGGSEWMIIIFVALVLILGTGKLPGAARKMGKAVNEYNKAKNEIQEQIKDVTDEVPKISGPVVKQMMK